MVKIEYQCSSAHRANPTLGCIYSIQKREAPLFYSIIIPPSPATLLVYHLAPLFFPIIIPPSPVTLLVYHPAHFSLPSWSQLALSHIYIVSRNQKNICHCIDNAYVASNLERSYRMGHYNTERFSTRGCVYGIQKRKALFHAPSLPSRSRYVQNFFILAF